MEDYNIITLGASGSGKTVFLASLFKELSLPTDEGIYLEVQDLKKQKKLTQIYAKVANDESWPSGTLGITKWHFTCCVRTPELLDDYKVCQFNYLDFAGGITTDIFSDKEGEIFEKELSDQIDSADAVLVLIDGGQLFKYIQTGYDLKDPGISTWLLTDLPNTIKLANKVKENPVHFVITKWDVLEGIYDLSTVRYCLESTCEEFKRLVQQRVRAGYPVRLIPISSVGKEFVTMQSDGSMKKNLGKVPKPFQLEIPLSYVLIDKVTAYYNNVDKENKDFEKSVQHKFGFLLDLIPDALKQGKLLTREERIQSLKNVSDSTTAFTYLINTFWGHIKEFEKNYPHSILGDDIKRPKPSQVDKEEQDKDSASFTCSQDQFDKLIKKFKTWLEGRNFKDQIIQLDESSILIQIAKKGEWRRFTGMAQALNIQLTQQNQKLTVKLSGGKWLERLAPVGIIAVLEAPLLPIIGISVGIGAWQQSKLPKEIIDFISNELT